MARVGAAIADRLREDLTAIALLDTVPGSSGRSAEVLLAERGTDRSRFPDARHLASWAGMCPGNAESGGKRLSGKTRKGNQALRQALIPIAHVASTTKDTSLVARYWRIAARRGKQRALVARGHTIPVIVYHILTRRQPYHELGVAYFDQLDHQRVEQRLARRLERLGYAVSLRTPQPEPSLVA